MGQYSKSVISQFSLSRFLFQNRGDQNNFQETVTLAESYILQDRNCLSTWTVWKNIFSIGSLNGGDIFLWQELSFLCTFIVHHRLYDKLVSRVF